MYRPFCLFIPSTAIWTALQRMKSKGLIMRSKKNCIFRYWRKFLRKRAFLQTRSISIVWLVSWGIGWWEEILNRNKVTGGRQGMLFYCKTHFTKQQVFVELVIDLCRSTSSTPMGSRTSMSPWISSQSLCRTLWIMYESWWIFKCRHYLSCCTLLRRLPSSSVSLFFRRHILNYLMHLFSKDVRVILKCVFCYCFADTCLFLLSLGLCKMCTSIVYVNYC